MTEARYFCPDCGSIDLVVEKSDVLTAAGGSGSTARCPNCEWQGALSSTIGAVSAEQFWDVERVANLLLRVVQKNAAGPMVQSLEFVGILPRMKSAPDDQTSLENLESHNRVVQGCRDHVLREMFAAAISAGFAAAEQANALYAQKIDRPVHSIFQEAEQ